MGVSRERSSSIIRRLQVHDQLATYDAIREHGSELVTIRHEQITVEVVEERAVETPVTAQGYVIQSDRIVYLGTGDTRSR